MPDFKNMKDLIKYVNNNVADVLDKEVSETVKETQSRKVHEEVYDAYDPFEYKRRADNGGLSDTRNMIHNFVYTKNSIEMIIHNVTTGAYDPNFETAGLVKYGHENGHGIYEYDMNRDRTEWKYLQRRPFISETVKELEKTLEHVESLKKGLRRRGFKME